MTISSRTTQHLFYFVTFLVTVIAAFLTGISESPQDLQRFSSVMARSLNQESSTSQKAQPATGTTKLSQTSISDLIAVDKYNLWAVGKTTRNDIEMGVVVNSTDAGKTWRDVLLSSNLRFSRVRFSGPQSGWLIGRTSDSSSGVLLRTSDGGKTWSSPQLRTEQLIFDFDFLGQSLGWVLSDEGTVFITANAGQNWNTVSLGETRGLNAISFYDEKNGWIVGESGQVFQSIDGGWTWRARGKDLIRLLDHFRLSEIDFKSVKFLSPKVGMIAAEFLVPRIGKTERVFEYHGVVFITEDGGKRWDFRIATTNLGLIKASALSERNIWILPRWGDRKGVLLHSISRGKTWSRVSIPSSDDIGWSYLLRFADKEHGWLLFHNGVYATIYRTTNGARVWEKL